MPRLTGGARLRWRTVKVLHTSGVIRVTRLTPSHAIRDFEAFVARVTPELNSVLRAEVARGPVKAKITLSVILSRGNGGETKPFASGKVTDANTLLPITRASEVAPQVAAVFSSSRPAVDLVIHFAAVAFVGESVAEPLRYYHNITSALLWLGHISIVVVRRSMSN